MAKSGVEYLAQHPGWKTRRPAPKQHEYAFDIKLWAVVRVMATSEKKAREAIISTLDCADLSKLTLTDPTVKITEASTIAPEEGEEYKPFEIDGKAGPGW